MEAIRRVRNDCMYRVVVLLVQPVKAISVNQNSSSVHHWFFPGHEAISGELVAVVLVSVELVYTSALIHKKLRRVQAEEREDSGVGPIRAATRFAISLADKLSFV